MAGTAGPRADSASTADCVARALNKIWREHRDASVSDLFNRCRISGRAAAVADIAPSTAPRTTAGALNLAERPDSAPLPQADAGENQPPMPTQSGPANQDEDRRLASASSPIRTNLNTGADAGGASVTQPSTAAGPTVNVKDYGASGSDNTYTCSIDAGSTTLTCTTPTDFQVGQYVAVPTAGIATPASASTAPTVTVTGSPGTSTICYEIVLGDPVEGLTAPSSPTCVDNSQPRSSMTLDNYNAITWPNPTANMTAGIYVSTDGGITYFLLDTMSSGTMGIFDRGQPLLPVTYDWPGSSPAFRNQTHYAQVLSGGGSTWSLATPATNVATKVNVRHDDTNAIESAILSLAAAGGGTVYFPAGPDGRNSVYHANRFLLFKDTSSTYTFTSSNSTGQPKVCSKSTPRTCISSEQQTVYPPFKPTGPTSPTHGALLSIFHPPGGTDLRVPKEPTPIPQRHGWHPM